MFKFEILYQSTKSRARVGRIHTAHGIIDTPSFVPVATQASLKAIDSTTLAALDVQLLFCNTYHLLLHPGIDVIAKAGGLHNFMQRHAPIITDSGGFQVFSLAYGGVANELKGRGKKKYEGSVLKISEDGVVFRSYRDGASVVLTPESSVQAQKALGADIIIPLDELPPYHIAADQLQNSLDRTHRWEQRSLEEHKKDPRHQAMYAVVHGGINPKLRQQSTAFLQTLPFDGFAIGGSLGKNHEEMIVMLQGLMPHMPITAPCHLLGIGDARTIAQGIILGIDTFDSSHPTRCARHGLLFTNSGDLKIMQSQYKSDLGPIDATCACIVCTTYSRAYVHHLFKANELTAYTLASIHNVAHMVRMMQKYRERILAGEL